MCIRDRDKKAVIPTDTVGSIRGETTDEVDVDTEYSGIFQQFGNNTFCASLQGQQDLNSSF